MNQRILNQTFLFFKEIMITSQEILVSDEMKESNGVRKLDFKWNLVDLDKINRTASDFICLSFNKPADQNRSDVIIGPTHLKIKDRDPLETALLLENLAVSLTKQAILKQTSPSIKSHEEEVEAKVGERTGKLNSLSIRYRKSFKKKPLKSEEAIAPIQEDNNTPCNMKALEKSIPVRIHHTKQKSMSITRTEPIAKEVSLNENKFLAKIKSRAIPKHTRSVSHGTSESVRNKSEKKPKKKEHKREDSLSGKRESVPSSKRDSAPPSKRDSVLPKRESVTLIPSISSPLAFPNNNDVPLSTKHPIVELSKANHRASRKDCNCILCLYEYNQRSKAVLQNKENMTYFSPGTEKLDQSIGSPSCASPICNFLVQNDENKEITIEEIQQTLKEMYS